MALETTFVYILFAGTSTLMICFGVLKLGMKTAILGTVLRDISECIGAFVVFFAINAAIGIVAVFLIRGVFGFLSLYVVTDFMLVLLSAIQGFVFQLWWRKSFPSS